MSTACRLLVAVMLAGCGGGDPDQPAQSCVDPPALVAWERVATTAAWSPRDSAAEYTHDGLLWIMGGWESSFEPNPRDVWSSTDGRTWSLVAQQASWTHGDLAASASFAGRMWLLGGWANGRLPGASSSNEVWSSVDGLNWQSHGRAQWDARLGAAAVAFKGRLWITGGVTAYFGGNAESLRNDVWSSEDGTQWTRATEHAPWSARAYHQLVVHGDRLYLMGGGNYLPQYAANRDVWSSSDGISWRQESIAAPWSARIWFSAVSYRGYLWVLGGWSNDPYRNWDDVWYSRDGQNWAVYNAGTQWSARHEQSVYVHEDALWVAGGFADPLTNDVWRLQLPAGWAGSCNAQGARS